MPTPHTYPRVVVGVLCAVMGASGVLLARPASAEPPVPAVGPVVDGSSSAQPLGAAFQRAFAAPGADEVVFSGTDAAYRNLIDGRADLILVRAGGADARFETSPVATDALVFWTSADNPADSVDLSQVRDIYAGRNLDGGQVAVAYRSPRPDAQAAMADLVGVPAEAPGLPLGTAQDVVHVAGGGPYPLGYDLRHDVASVAGVKLLAVDGVAPTPAAIQSGEYPLVVRYDAVIDAATGTDAPARQWVAAMTGPAGRQIVAEAGYVPLGAPLPWPGGTVGGAPYAVNPLTVTRSVEYLQGTAGCVAVTRLHVTGLADAARQDDLGRRFRALQDALAGFTPTMTHGGDPFTDPAAGETTEPVPREVLATCDGVTWRDAAGTVADPYTTGAAADFTQVPAAWSGATLGGAVDASFANVLSLRATASWGGTASLNVRLDTGEDLSLADLFTPGTDVGALIGRASVAAGSCDTACAAGLAQAYRDAPGTPFGFTPDAATVGGVSLPFAPDWSRVAIFTAFAAVPGLYATATPAWCRVGDTAWDEAVWACVPLAPAPEHWGTLDSPAPGGVVDVPLAVGAGEGWFVRGAEPCATAEPGVVPDVDPTSGTGPGAVAWTLPPNPAAAPAVRTLCVLAVDATTRAARYGEVTVTQAGAPAVTAPAPAAPAPVVTGANASLIAGTAASMATTVRIAYPRADDQAGFVDAVVDVTGAWTIDVPDDAVDGTASAVALDAAGTRSAAAPFALDVSAPEPPMVVSAPGDHLMGTAEPGSHVVALNAEGRLLGEVGVAAGGTWDIVLASPLAPGETAGLTATDAVGNTSAVATFTAPQPVRTPAYAWLTLSSGTVRVAGGACATPGVPDPSTLTATVTVQDETGAGVSGVPLTLEPDPPFVFDPSTPAVTDDEGVAVVHLDVDPSRATTGMAWVRARLPDPAVVIAPVGVSVDVAAPAELQVLPRLSVVAATGGSVVWADGTDAWLATVTARDACGVPRPGVTVSLSASGHAVVSATTLTTDQDGRARATITDLAAERVVFGASIRQGDQAIDLNGSPGTWLFTTRPAQPVSLPTIEVANATRVSGTAPAGSSVTLTYATETGRGTLAGVPVSDGAWRLDTMPADARDGPLEATAVDPSGAVSPGAGVLLDRVAPGPVTLVSPCGRLDGSVADPFDPGVAVTLAFVLSDHTSVALTHVPVADDGTWSVPGPACDDVVSVRAVAIDAAGNVSVPVVAIVAPAAVEPPVILTPADGAYLDRSDVTVAGSGVPGNAVAVVDGAGVSRCIATVREDGTWGCAVAGLGEGSWVLQCAQSDPTGAVSGAGEPVRFTVDVTAPPPPTVTAADARGVAGSGEPFATLTLTWPDGAQATATADPVGAWHLDVAPGQGSGTIRAVQTDRAGNVSDPVIVAFAPAADAPLLGATLAGRTFTFTGVGFAPGETVAAGIHSAEVTALTPRVADAAGMVAFAWTVPSDWTPGPHEIALTGAASGIVRATFTVPVLIAAGPVTPDGGAQAGTGGAAVSPPWTVPAGLVVAGCALLVLRRGRAYPVA